MIAEIFYSVAYIEFCYRAWISRLVSILELLFLTFFSAKSFEKIPIIPFEWPHIWYGLTLD